MGQCHVMVTRHSAFYTPLLVTIGGGFLAAEGMEADFSIAETPRDVLAGIHGGSVQVVQSTPLCPVSRRYRVAHKQDAEGPPQASGPGLGQVLPMP